MHEFDDDDDTDLLEHHFDEEEAHRHMFRCTYCEALIPRRVEPEELGLTSHDAIQLGQQYPYTGCWCGWGKFVVCER